MSALRRGRAGWLTLVSTSRHRDPGDHTSSCDMHDPEACFRRAGRGNWTATMSWATAAFILDLSCWAHRAWHAVARDTPAGVQPDMVPPAANMLVKLLAEKAPAWLVAAADSPGPVWQHELYPAYKANRPPHPPGFDAQLVEVSRLFELHRIPVIGAPKHQADDVIAALTRRFRRAGIPVVIVGADKDVRQLVTDQRPAVIMWDGKDKVTRAATIREEWGIEPDRVGDYLALVGDEGDGVPGLRGIGPKRATDLLEGTRDLEDMLRLKQWAQSSVGAALRTGTDQLRLWRRLVALRDDVPLSVDLGACALGGYDVDGLRAFYAAHGLERLAARMNEAPAKRAVSAETAAAWSAEA